MSTDVICVTAVGVTAAVVDGQPTMDRLVPKKILRSCSVVGARDAFLHSYHGTWYEVYRGSSRIDSASRKNCSSTYLVIVVAPK